MNKNRYSSRQRIVWRTETLNLGLIVRAAQGCRESHKLTQCQHRRLVGQRRYLISRWAKQTRRPRNHKKKHHFIHTGWFLHISDRRWTGLVTNKTLVALLSCCFVLHPVGPHNGAECAILSFKFQNGASYTLTAPCGKAFIKQISYTKACAIVASTNQRGWVFWD